MKALATKSMSSPGSLSTFAKNTCLCIERVADAPWARSVATLFERKTTWAKVNHSFFVSVSTKVHIARLGKKAERPRGMLRRWTVLMGVFGIGMVIAAQALLR